ncbi:3-phytase A [Trametes pubescens]|uniref:3-phytase A n=1 Tax=Trametes pubescens TaxID=154538 RepID=A0A1M2V9Q1_TRAPU|nr:3-phytase A [Trametes pubescens]
MRMKYGFPLHNFTASNSLPVFRTESQDRTLSSALNFALGLFGHPLDGKYQQLITIQEHGCKNTLASSKTYTNSHDHAKGDRGTPYVRQWSEMRSSGSARRSRASTSSPKMCTLCSSSALTRSARSPSPLPFERTDHLRRPWRLGTRSSASCSAEWARLDYSVDLHFWYSFALVARFAWARIGYVQELVARLSHTPIASHNSSTNATFPLDQSLYVDATHQLVVLNVLTALNLTSFARDGPLPATHILHNRAFRIAHLAPFATNVQFQHPHIRVIVNDGVVPLMDIRGCPENANGACPMPVIIDAMREIIKETD